MALDAKTLIKLKADIEAARIRRAKSEGALASLMKRLQEDYGCASTVKAKELLDQKNSEIQAMELEVSRGCADLEKLLNA